MEWTTLKNVAASCTISVGTATTACVVTVQLKDWAGNNLTEPGVVMGYISSDAAGLTQSTVTSATVATGGQFSIEATKAYMFLSTAAGSFSTSLDGTGANSRYFNIVLSNGRVVHSTIITFTG